MKKWYLYLFVWSNRDQCLLSHEIRQRPEMIVDVVVDVVIALCGFSVYRHGHGRIHRALPFAITSAVSKLFSHCGLAFQFTFNRPVGDLALWNHISFSQDLSQPGIRLMGGAEGSETVLSIPPFLLVIFSILNILAWAVPTFYVFLCSILFKIRGSRFKQKRRSRVWISTIYSLFSTSKRHDLIFIFSLERCKVSLGNLHCSGIG